MSLKNLFNTVQNLGGNYHRVSTSDEGPGCFTG